MLGFRSRNSDNRRRVLRRVYVVAAVLLVALLARLLPGVIGGISAVLLLPAHEMQQWLRETESGFPYWFRDRATVMAEMDRWRRAAQTNATVEAVYQRLEEENRTLRQLLGATTSPRILAGVIATPETLPYDLVQLDSGARDGVVVGAPVFVGRSAVVGSIVYVADTYSIASLVSTPGLMSTVYLPRAEVFAQLEGVGGGVARVRVPQGVSLALGDVVLLPGSEPAEFGLLSHIVNEPTQPEQFGYVVPARPLRGRGMVTIGRESVVPMSRVEVQEFMRATTSPWFIDGTLGTLDDVMSATTSDEYDNE